MRVLEKLAKKLGGLPSFRRTVRTLPPAPQIIRPQPQREGDRRRARPQMQAEGGREDRSDETYAPKRRARRGGDRDFEGDDPELGRQTVPPSWRLRGDPASSFRDHVLFPLLDRRPLEKSSCLLGRSLIEPCRNTGHDVLEERSVEILPDISNVRGRQHVVQRPERMPCRQWFLFKYVKRCSRSCATAKPR